MSSAAPNGSKGPYVGSRLRLLHQWVWDRIYEGVRASGHRDLNPAHVSLLRYPSIHGQRPSAIADKLQITKQSVNELLSHLEARGYVTRQPDLTDRRARIVQLTAKGKRLEQTTFDAARDAEGELSKMLGAARFREMRASLDELVRLTGQAGS